MTKEQLENQIKELTVDENGNYDAEIKHINRHVIAGIELMIRNLDK